LAVYYNTALKTKWSVIMDNIEDTILRLEALRNEVNARLDKLSVLRFFINNPDIQSVSGKVVQEYNDEGGFCTYVSFDEPEYMEGVEPPCSYDSNYSDQFTFYSTTLEAGDIITFTKPENIEDVMLCED
jgi:hypothetical protein